MRTLTLLFQLIQSNSEIILFVCIGVSTTIAILEIFFHKEEYVRDFYWDPDEEKLFDFIRFVRRPLFGKHPSIDKRLRSIAVLTWLLSIFAAYLTDIRTLLLPLVVFPIFIWTLKFMRAIGVLYFIATVLFIATMAWSINQFGWLNPFVVGGVGLVIHEIWFQLQGRWKTRIMFIAVPLIIWFFIELL